VRLFVAGQALSGVGTFSQLVAQSLLLLDLSDSGFALGATMSVQAVPMLALLAFTGLVSLPWILALAVGCVQTFDRPAAQAISAAEMADSDSANGPIPRPA